jgi:hypothetical protein
MTALPVGRLNQLIAEQQRILEEQVARDNASIAASVHNEQEEEQDPHQLPPLLQQQRHYPPPPPSYPRRSTRRPDPRYSASAAKRIATIPPANLPIKFTVDKLPANLKRSPCYLFAKAVAGEISKMDMNEMFDLEILSTQTEIVTIESFHQVFLTGIMKANRVLTRACYHGGLRKPQWDTEIVENPRCDLYIPFFMLVAAYMRESRSMGDRGSDSTKQILEFRKLRQEAEFELMAMLKGQ